LTRILETTLNHLRDTTFHIEVQTDYDDTIDERILVYSVLIKRKIKKPKVKTLLINLAPNPKCQLLGKRDFGNIKIEYEVRNLWEQSYEEVKRHHLTGLLPFTPPLKGAGKAEILEASVNSSKQKFQTLTNKLKCFFYWLFWLVENIIRPVFNYFHRQRL